MWEGQGEGWKKESTVKNEILKGRLEIKSDGRVCDKSKNALVGEMMFITVTFPKLLQPSLHLSHITDFISSFFGK